MYKEVIEKKDYTLSIEVNDFFDAPVMHLTFNNWSKSVYEGFLDDWFSLIELLIDVNKEVKLYAYCPKEMTKKFALRLGFKETGVGYITEQGSMEVLILCHKYQ